MKQSLLFLFLVLFVACNTSTKQDHQITRVKKALVAPTLDGFANEAIWQQAAWLALDQKWLGDDYTAADFNGRYKLSWAEDALYLLVEITDDVLIDQHQDPLTLWWDDDCVEIFIDEDNSGGEHQYNHNAFAYHVAMDGNVVDMDTTKKGRLYNEHVTMAKTTLENTTTWELKVSIYNDSFKDGELNKAVKLEANKKLGFALAYCDNDGSAERENFIGSVYVPGEDKNQGWINASIFGTLILEE